MASWNSSLYTSQGSVPPAGKSDAVSMPQAKNVRGKLRLAKVFYTWNGAEAAGDIINLLQSKAAARVLPENSQVLSYANAANANLVINIGDPSNAFRYSNGLTVFANTAANGVVRQEWTNCTSPLLTTIFAPNDITVPYIPPTPLSNTDQTVVQAKIVSTSNVAANSVVVFTIAVVDE